VHLAHEGIGYGAVAESAWWGTGHIHVLGSGQLGQGAQGDGGALRGPGEDPDVHAWERAAAGAATAPADTDGANGLDRPDRPCAVACARGV